MSSGAMLLQLMNKISSTKQDQGPVLVWMEEREIHEQSRLNLSSSLILCILFSHWTEKSLLKKCVVLLFPESSSCQLFRKNLRALLNRQKKTTQHVSGKDPPRNMNNCYMTSEQKKAKLSRLQLINKVRKVTIKRLKSKILKMSVSEWI